MFEPFEKTYEDFIPLSSLVSTIRERLQLNNVLNHSSVIEQEQTDIGTGSDFCKSSNQCKSSDKESSHYVQRHPSTQPNVECVLVEEEDSRDKILGRYQKRMLKNKVTQQAEIYLNGLCNSSLGCNSKRLPVLAVNIPFGVMRDFGTFVMKNSISIMKCITDFIRINLIHKKVIRSLATDLDLLIRRRRDNTNHNDIEKNKGYLSNSISSMSVFLYSIPEEKFDLVSIELQ